MARRPQPARGEQPTLLVRAAAPARERPTAERARCERCRQFVEVLTDANGNVAEMCGCPGIRLVRRRPPTRQEIAERGAAGTPSGYTTRARSPEERPRVRRSGAGRTDDRGPPGGNAAHGHVDAPAGSQTPSSGGAPESEAEDRLAGSPARP